MKKSQCDIKALASLIKRLGLQQEGWSGKVLKGGPFDGLPHSWPVGRIVVLPWAWKCWAVYVVKTLDSTDDRLAKFLGPRYPGAAIFKGFASSEKKGKAEVLVEESAPKPRLSDEKLDTVIDIVRRA